MAAAQAPPTARPWNPAFTHTDRERWICVYPAYINSKKTLAEGRKIAKEKAVDNPLYTEIRDVCAAAGMVVGVENKVHPRELDSKDPKFRGRIRIQLRNDDGTPRQPQYTNRYDIYLYIADAIARLKTRQQGASASQGQGQAQGEASGGGAAGGGKKKGGKGKKK